MTQRMRTRAAVAALLALLGLALAAGDLGFSRSLTPGLIAKMEQRFDRRARGRLEGWQAFVRETSARAKARDGAEDADLLRPVNGFFNRVPAIEDKDHWEHAEYDAAHHDKAYSEASVIDTDRKN